MKLSQVGRRYAWSGKLLLRADFQIDSSCELLWREQQSVRIRRSTP